MEEKFLNKVFYLCGGMGKFGKEHFDKANEWRLDIKNQIEEISGGKVKCCNPNDHYNFLNDEIDLDQREIMNYDLHKVRNSNAIIVNFNDPKSIGSACEMAIAFEHRIPIIGLCKKEEYSLLHPWLKEFCEKIFSNREDLVFYLVQHYINDD